jgi:hypothetical protein
MQGKFAYPHLPACAALNFIHGKETVLSLEED